MPRRPLLLFLLLAAPLAWAPVASGQAAALRGFVADAADGQPLPAVNVTAEALADGRSAGAATDTDGFYTLAGLRAGTYVVRASFVGYAAFADTVTLAAGEVRQLNVRLTPGGSCSTRSPSRPSGRRGRRASPPGSRASPRPRSPSFPAPTSRPTS